MQPLFIPVSLAIHLESFSLIVRPRDIVLLVVLCGHQNFTFSKTKIGQLSFVNEHDFSTSLELSRGGTEPR